MHLIGGGDDGHGNAGAGAGGEVDEVAGAVRGVADIPLRAVDTDMKESAGDVRGAADDKDELRAARRAHGAEADLRADVEALRREDLVKVIDAIDVRDEFAVFDL